MSTNDQDLSLTEILSNPKSAEEYEWGHFQILTIDRTAYTEKELKDHLYVDDQGTLEIWSNSQLDFMNITDCLYLPDDKWLLLLCRFADHADKVNELIEIAKEIFPKCNNVIIKEEVLRQSRMNNSDMYVLSDWLEQKNVSFKEFITNPAYVVFFSPNPCFKDLIACGIINSKIIKEYADEYTFTDED